MIGPEIVDHPAMGLVAYPVFGGRQAGPALFDAAALDCQTASESSSTSVILPSCPPDIGDGDAVTLRHMNIAQQIWPERTGVSMDTGRPCRAVRVLDPQVVADIVAMPDASADPEGGEARHALDDGRLMHASHSQIGGVDVRQRDCRDDGCDHAGKDDKAQRARASVSPQEPVAAIEQDRDDKEGDKEIPAQESQHARQQRLMDQSRPRRCFIKSASC